jgi:phosphoribosylformylglycinamidine synthase
LRPDIAWDLKRMVETIADLSEQLGIPFISGKDSSSGTMESGGRRIDVPPTLVVSVLGRVPDVKEIVTKDFRSPGDRIVLVGRANPDLLGGSVYADSYGQRGDRLFDAYDAASIRAQWDTILHLHREGAYLSGSAIAEGGVFLRLFEASFGSGLGARIDLNLPIKGRRDGLLFGEFVGSVLLEVPPGMDSFLDSVPHYVLGEVIEEPRLILTEAGHGVWQDSISSLAAAWSKTFREVVE